MPRVTRLLVRTRRAVASLVAGITLVGLAAAPASTTPATGTTGHDRRVVIQYTEYGMPHITAADYPGLGYGYGYASAKDNLCVLADAYLTVNAERSRHFGADAPANPGLGAASDSLTSDLYFQRLKDSGTVERLVGQPPPLGPEPEVAQLVRGYVQGYNRHIAEATAKGVIDPACRGKSWVRPIAPIDVYRHIHAVTTMSGAGSFMDGIAGARPPAGDGPVPAPPAEAAAGLDAAIRAARGDGEMGSNALGIGADGTSGSRGVLLANPHFPWHGVRRFWQSHLTIPGRLDVSGASLLGFPAVLIGHNHNVAWTHTVSTATTYGLYEVPLVPGEPTRYLVDGVPEAMKSHRVQVRVREKDGTTGTVERTLWETRYGPVIGAGPGGFPLPWGNGTAFTLRDANATNLRALNTWLGLGRAGDTDEVRRVQSRTQGLPWVNTVAVDRRGDAYYSDIQVVPHVTDELAKQCSTPLGERLFATSGVPVLNGGRGACAWGSDPDAVEPGLLGPGRLPRLARDDYVTNSNNSPWLTNPGAPLTGYPRIVGDTGTPRSLRTQEGILSVQRRLAGTDGLPGRGFSRTTMERMLFRDHSRAAELAAADTAVMCRSFPDGAAPSSQGPVDVSTACEALADWDGRYSLQSRGSLLFARFVAKAASVAGGPWQVGFDPADPLRTPNTLDVDHPEVRRAFGDAAAELRTAGIRLDARLGDHQYVVRNGERIPLHGGPHELGVLNVITPKWDAAAGNTEVTAGSSFLQVTEFPDRGAPRTSSLLTYAQSGAPTSPHYADQTRLYAAGTWVRERFTQEEILASPRLRTLILTGR
ncbi:penicillin acylase family protein [Streptomyces sp. NPDC051662]|uniref:penicillin acylase family protein n=1 Tax=Streptomyces sp. NPDC051662 TaxID=3154750 RepID=UPI003431C234